MPIDHLRRHPLFALFDPAALAPCLAAAIEQSCSTGDLLCQTGTPGAGVFLLLAGRVRVLRPARLRGEVTLGLLNPGDLFGEYSLVPPGNNTATCRTTTPSQLLRLPLDDVRDLLSTHAVVADRLKDWVCLHTTLAYLRDRSCFGFMSATSGLRLADQLQPGSFEIGQTIQAPGLADDRWYFIESGEVRLEPADRSAPRTLGPGECFGERALADIPGLPAATAVAPTRCLWLCRDIFAPGSSPSASRLFQSVLGPQGSFVPFQALWVGQQDASECGLAALAMIARYRHIAMSPAQLRPLARLTPQGLNLQQLQRLAGILRLPCRAALIDAGRLQEVVLPAVAHFRDGHYVVVFSAQADRVVVGDPASGVVALSWPTWHQRFSGHLLVFPCAVTTADR